MSKQLPIDYDERVYAGWLGKCIGVRFGAPIEGWTYEEIRDNIGPLDGYLNEAPGKLFKPDDDTAFPMVLIRALEDCDASPDLTAQQISDARLNYLGNQHGTYWWGGYGISSGHTSYINAAKGVPAPLCGSIEMNGLALSEQIGGQIFSDIWGLVAPNNPALAADLAERAASISHDGNGVYGGRFIAALVSQAFSESDPFKLIEVGLSLIPADSEYTRVIRAVLDFYHQHPDDWHECFAFLKANFGYDRYPGEVHIIPNTGVIIMALAYGQGDFSRTVQIANMAGWDTDCNVGNVGAIMGVAVGLDGIDWSWREPMNDLLIASSIIGTRNIITIPQCADLFCRLGRQMAGEQPETSSRYHFNYPGSTNNFLTQGERGRVIELRQVTLEDGKNALQASLRKLNKKGETRIYTRTYYQPKELSSNYYEAVFTPLIHPGQTITAQVYLPEDAPDSIWVSLYVYDDNHDESHQGQAISLTPGTWHTLTYQIPALANACFYQAGIVVKNMSSTQWTTGSLYIGSLDWEGVPDYSTDFSLERTETGSSSQWTHLYGYWRIEDGAYHGSGVEFSETYTGDINWDDYTLEVKLIPIVGEHHNINTRVQGALRSYAFGLAPDNKVVLYKKKSLEKYQPLAEAAFKWRHGETYTLKIVAQGNTLLATVSGDGQDGTLRWTDDANAYLTGQIGLSVWHGSHTRFVNVRVSPPENEF
jgi:ADP-ribosylglycohydrolase